MSKWLIKNEKDGAVLALIPASAFPGNPLLTPLRRRLRDLMRGYREGAYTQVDVRQSVRSWIGHLSHGDTWGLRAALLERAVFVRGDADGE